MTRGDLSRSIQVDAQGEVEILKDDVNEMIRNLRETTATQPRSQDWLKTNLARFGRMLQGQRDLHIVARIILTELAPLVGMQRGVFYLRRRGWRPAELTLSPRIPARWSRSRRPRSDSAKGCSASAPRTAGGSSFAVSHPIT